MKNIKTICYLAMLTALYVVLSAFLKLYVGVGNIQLDLGYIVFTVALCMFGIKAAIVGVIGCTLESILFTAYGFSISWAVANMIIGIGCGIVFGKTNKLILRILAILIFTFIGMAGAKTAIECYLYSIPFAVKIPKNLTAFALDSAVMIAGLFLSGRVKPKRETDGN